MTTEALGAGACPAGSSPAGYGVAEAIEDDTTIVYRDARTGQPMAARAFDPVTGQYVTDARGRVLGMPATQHLVYLALRTERGSAVLTDLGNRLRRIKRFSRSFDREVRDAVAEALQHLTSTGLIELIAVTTGRVTETSARVAVKWRDVASKKIRTEFLN